MPDETSLAVRIPYSTEIHQNFGIDRNTWKVLVEAVWPGAQNTESVIMALSYCKARQLDPLKRVVHIVPIWNKAKNCMVDTVWPGIAEARTTAARTKSYAGRDMTVFGPDMTMTWGEISVTFPEWAQITVYRLVGGLRVAFAGAQVYWTETFASVKDGTPNAMWQKRPRGQLDKCAERTALAAAFPEELGDEFTDIDGPGIYQHMDANACEPPKPPIQQPQRKPVASKPVANGKSPDHPASEADQRIELAGICEAIVGVGMTVTTEDYKAFSLVEATDGEDGDTICAKLSAFLGRDGKAVGGKSAANLSATALAITIKKARELKAQLPTYPVPDPSIQEQPSIWRCTRNHDHVFDRKPLNGKCEKCLAAVEELKD